MSNEDSWLEEAYEDQHGYPEDDFDRELPDDGTSSWSDDD